MKKCDILVIGAGLIGLASAWQALRKEPKRKLIVLEKEKNIAEHQSSRNSGVIHSGIYYSPHTLKAKNCVEGYALLLEFCREKEIFFDLCGKLIVATEESQFSSLEQLKQNAIAHKLSNVGYLSSEEIKEKEAFVKAKKALWVPQAGRVSYVEVARKLAESIQEMGGEIYCEEKLESLQEKNTQFYAETTKNEYQAKKVLNCAGLFSDRIASWTEKKLDFRIIPFRGEYYELVEEKQNIIQSMIYPAPDLRFPFLGIHFTKTMEGKVELGPNAILALKREGYAWGDISYKDFWESLSWPGFYRFALKHWKIGLEELSKSLWKYSFLRAARKIIPSLKYSDLKKKRSGVRAQACNREGKLVDDFIFFHRKNIIHLCNVPSPAATSCLAIGRRVAELLKED